MSRFARKAMTPARRGRIIARQHGVCARAGCESTGPFEIDHVVPLELAADAEHHARLEAAENLEALCVDHHALKTKQDRRMIARAKRLAGETCAAPTKRPLRTRGFGSVHRGLNGQLQTSARARRAAAQEETHDPSEG